MLRGAPEPVFFQLPRNFLFFQRLPARFAMQILSAGNETPRGRWYEVEISGQKLNLLSRVPLKPGTAVMVEKAGDFELKLLHFNQHETTAGRSGGDVPAPVAETRVSEFRFSPENLLDIASLLVLQEWSEQEQDIIKPERAAVYRFTLPGEPAVAGAFTGEEGRWRLYLSDILTSEEAAELGTWLSDLGVIAVHLLPERELLRLGSGLDIIG